MNDEEFSELKLRATIVPKQASWPAPEYVHWQRLHAVADEARDRVRRAYAEIAEVDRDADLSREGKERRTRAVALRAITEFEGSRTLTVAREAVARVVDRWDEKVGMVVKPPSDIAEATVHAQIRDRLAAMKTGKLGFLEKHAADPVVASAILTAPTFLSGLSEAELALVRKRVESHVPTEIAEAREQTLKGLEQAEAGWQRAIAKIGERAGLVKGPDGTWHSRSEAVAA